MLEVQKFLQAGTLEQLEATFGINAKRHPEFPNLVMLKYSQTGSPMGERIVRECRGIILNEAEGWSVVSRPYDKFFNLGEGHASPIDWPSAKVYEKLDGSLITMYHYRGWRVASSGMPDAGGPVGAGGGLSFAELFWRTWKELGYAMPTDTGLCYMFELMSPHNRVVIPHVENKIVLHGARRVVDGGELLPESAAENGWSVVKSYPLACESDCVAAALELKPMENEGYVVCDKHFNRVKIKSPKYVALAHAKEGCSPRRMLELVRQNESSEFLTYFPEMQPAYDDVKERWERSLAMIASAYEVYRQIPVQKDFAAAVLKTDFAPVLFALRSGKFSTPADFLRAATIYTVEKLLGMESVAA